MKKMIYIFFIILFLPINVFAYSRNIIPGGESIGIKINSNGLIVVGFYKVNNEYIAKNNIKIGDKIIKINDIDVYKVEDFTKYINEYIDDNLEVNIELIRNDKNINTKLKLIKEKNVYKTGIYVKDKVIGLGTLTYIDPVSKIYGSLGHEITINETNNRVEVKNGNILSSKITSIDKSRNGRVGSKNATIFYNDKIGDILKNNDVGVYGYYKKDTANKSAMEIANYEEIKKGEAYILTVTNNQEIKKYKINILDKYDSKKSTNKAFGFEIIDRELINKTGGIVQGMSGSPIIQDNKLIGAVTNVVVDHVNLGYGISIITMLENGDKISN